MDYDAQFKVPRQRPQTAWTKRHGTDTEHLQCT